LHPDASFSREAVLPEPGDLRAPAAGVPKAVPDATHTAPAPTVESTLRQVVDVVETHVPATTDPITTRLPDSVELSKIGDDLGVTSEESPVDVRALLTQGVDVPPTE
jgi:hypothetical protein